MEHKLDNRWITLAVGSCCIGYVVGGITNAPYLGGVFAFGLYLILMVFMPIGKDGA